MRVCEHPRFTSLVSIADCRKIFAFSFHSPSLLLGSTPYVTTEAHAQNFFRTIDLYLEHFLNELGCEGKTPLQLLDYFKALDVKSE